MKFTRLLTLAASAFALIVAGSVGASAQSTLEIVKKRGLSALPGRRADAGVL